MAGTDGLKTKSAGHGVGECKAHLTPMLPRNNTAYGGQLPLSGG